MNNNFEPTEDEWAFAQSSMQAHPVLQERRQKHELENPNQTSSEQELDFAKESWNQQPEEEIPSNIPWYEPYYSQYKSKENAFLKGLGQEGVSLGESFGGLMRTPEKKKQDVQKREKVLEEYFPSEDQPIERRLKTLGRLVVGGATSVLTGGASLPSTIARTFLATELGEQAKDLGLGEMGQGIAELFAFAAPNPTRIIQSSSAEQQKILDFARSQGLSEEQIAPLIQENSWINRVFQRFATKGSKSKKILEGSHKGLGEIYDQLANSTEAQKVLSTEQIQDFLINLKDSFIKVPSNVRNNILGDLADLAKGPATGESLIRFKQKVGDSIGSLGERGKKLGGIVDDVKIAIGKLSPKLGEELGIADKLYTNYIKMKTVLKPSQIEPLINSAKGIGALSFLLTGKWEQLKGLMGIQLGKKIALEMISNPRLQNLQHKMLRALKDNQTQVANSLLRQFKDEIKEELPEFYKELGNEEFPTTYRKAKK